jgi:hypothetical protein
MVQIFCFFIKINPHEGIDMQTIAYTDRIIEALTPLNPKPMSTYRGDDITQFEKIETEMMTHTMRCFNADKIDKIVTIKADIMGGEAYCVGHYHRPG